MYCVKCGVRLNDGVDACPLCRTPVWNPETKIEPEANYSARYPIPPKSKRYPILAFITILLAAVCLSVLIYCLNQYGQVAWSGYVMLGVALVYVYGRLPIMIATIGMALLYESVTPLIFGGGGVNLVSVKFIKQLSAYPTVLIPFACAVAVYAVYNYVATTGKQSVLLAKNQQAAVNIGVNENKNVILSYVYSGLIFGFATIIWASLGKRDASFSSLSTVGELFSNILPVFVGLYIGAFCGDTIGIIMGSLAICMMKTGLTTLFKAELGGAISTAMMGLFVFIVNLVAGQSGNLKKLAGKLFARHEPVKA